jgi:arylsulfatase A-like enzyme
VLLVTIDTLRADHLSSYGYSRQTSPFLDELAASGVRFERAYATSSWTAPSVASLLTSLEPTVHGIEHGRLENQVVVKQEVLAESVTLWPELMREAGYRTFGVTANTHLYGRFGFDQGFDRYECVGFLDADAVLAAVDSLRDEIVSGEKPWFLWVHLLDPHARYVPRPPWIADYFPRHLKQWFPVRGVLVPEGYKKFGAEVGTPLYDLIHALYDSEIAYADDSVRKLATSLGISGSDLVVVTSDHGEEFLDHDRFGHGATLFEEVIRIPLILRLPGAEYAGRTVGDPVSLIDVLPTVLEVLGVDASAELQGRSLIPLIEDRERTERIVMASLERFKDLGTDSVTRGKWKYIQHRVEADQRMLFDIEGDPSETENLVTTHPGIARELAEVLTSRLEAGRARAVEPGAVDLTDDEFEQLKALGYIPK